MRPGIRSQELVVVLHTLAQVQSEAVIDGAAIGIVGDHVAEGHGNAQSQVVLLRDEIGNGQARGQNRGQRRIQSGATEETQESGVDPRTRGTCSTGNGPGSSKQRIGSRWLSIGNGPRVESLPVLNKDLGICRICIDGPVQVMSAGVVVSRTDRELILQVVLNRKPCLFRVSVLKVFPIWEPERLRNQRYRCTARASGKVSLIVKQRWSIGCG